MIAFSFLIISLLSLIKPPECFTHYHCICAKSRSSASGTHKAETAPHGANADVIAKSLALRTATGTLKAAKATENDELVNFELLNEMERALNAELKEAFKKVDNELAEIIRAGTPAISSDNFGRQEEAERGEALNKRVNETAAYHNALRNERGSLAMPEAVSDAEAVNKKQLEAHVSGKIAELVGGAPGTLNTLKEIADALKGDASIVDTLTQQIANAKTEAVQTAEADATSKANAAQAEATQYTNSKLAGYYTKAEVDESQRVQDEKIAALEAARPTSGAGALYDFSKAEAVKTAKAEATQYTDSKLVDYYTKADVDERIKKLEAARPTSGAGALYDFSQTEAVKTGETIKLVDGTVKDIYRLCVEQELASQSLKVFSVPLPATAQNILKIDGYSFIANEIVPITEACNFSIEDGKIYLVQKDTTKQFLSSRVIINCF